jgi:capsular polysaccharide transport system permease protein
MLTKSHKNINRWLAILLVFTPVTIVSLYMFLYAQDRYVSESVVVVKQVSEPSASPMSGLGVLLGKNNTSVEDAQYLKEYIESPDMVDKLDKKLNFRKSFSGNMKDPLFQLSSDATREKLLRFYRNRVTINLDENTYLLTISTEGFSSDFAHRFNREILLESEVFINEISQKVASEQLLYSEKQLKESAQKLLAAKEKLISYQNENQTFDPVVNATAVNSLIANLKGNLADLQTQERTLLSYLNPDAAQVVALRSQMSSVAQQIDNEQDKLTSVTGNKLNRQAVQFETLKADVDFGTDLYKLSLTSLETTRLEAFRKMKSLVVISSAQPAQEAVYPRRYYIVFSALLICGLFYGLIRLMLSVIRDHRD